MSDILVVGIDPSSEKLAVTITPLDDSSDITMRKFMLSKGNKQLARAQAYAAMLKLVHSYPMADLRVFMEYPISWRSGTATIQLAGVHGAATAGLIRAGIKVLVDVNNQTWKRSIIAPVTPGRLDKTKIAHAMQQIWPAAFEMAKGDQDLIDSAAINRYGHTVVAKAEKMRAKGTTKRKIGASRDRGTT